MKESNGQFQDLQFTWKRCFFGWWKDGQLGPSCWSVSLVIPRNRMDNLRSTIHLEKVVFCLMKRWSAGTQLLKCIVGHSESSFWRWDTKEGYFGDYLGISCKNEKDESTFQGSYGLGFLNFYDFLRGLSMNLFHGPRWHRTFPSQHDFGG